MLAIALTSIVYLPWPQPCRADRVVVRGSYGPFDEAGTFDVPTIVDPASAEDISLLGKRDEEGAYDDEIETNIVMSTDGEEDGDEGDGKKKNRKKEDVDDDIKALKKSIKKLKKDIEDNEDRSKKNDDRLDDMEDPPTVVPGGSFQLDWAHFDQDLNNQRTVGDFDNGAEIRRARVSLSGSVTEFIDYELEVALTADDEGGGAGDLSFLDVYAEFEELAPWGSVIIGHFKEPFGLERQAGSSSVTFMERSLADNFSPGRNLGAMVRRQSSSEDVHWSLGVFRSDFSGTTGTGVGDDGGYSVGTRLVWLPVYDQVSDGRGLVHVGVAYNYHDEQDNEIRFRGRPESHLADFFASTGRIAASDFHLIGLEAALVHGPMSVQSEYVRAIVNSIGGPQLEFDGLYVYASLFLTGEHRRYSRRRGAFRGPKPFEEFFSVPTPSGICRGRGAWEVALRWSHLDLNDPNSPDEEISDMTVGLNWYLNDDMRVSWNYVDAMLEDPQNGRSTASVYQMRFQTNF